MREVIQFGGAQETFGRDVQLGWLADFSGEVLTQSLTREQFVAVVDASPGRVVGESVHQVANVVYKCRRDRRRRRVRLLGERRGLQRVLPLRNGFLAVLGNAALSEEPQSISRRRGVVGDGA